MDKILPLIGWIKKNRFWLGSGLLSVAMVATWFLITMSIGKQTAESQSKITQSINSGEAILKVTAEEGVSAHANVSTQVGMKSELTKSLDEIVKAWNIRHQAQQAILKWPTEIIGNDEFVSAFSQFDPPETFPEKYDKGHGLERYRELYRVAIPKQMDKICKEILRAKWNYDPEFATAGAAPSSQPSGGGRPGGGRTLGPPGGELGDLGGSGSVGTASTSDDLGRFAVVWDEKNQALWHSKLTDFAGKDDHFVSDEAPTPLQIYMLQQDLWLLEAMFTIIRQINGDVKSNDLAAIKKIYHVAFGREARTQEGALTPLDMRLASGGGDPVPDEAVVDLNALPGTAGAAASDTGAAFDILASYSPYHGRYVTVDFKPIPAEIVRAILTAKEIPTENLELIVAKRVPVRIALRMDERKIPEFMTACANSPFAFEINQVRLNRYVPGKGIVLNGGGHGASNSGGSGLSMGGRGGAGAGEGSDQGEGRGGIGGRGGALGNTGADLGGTGGAAGEGGGMGGGEALSATPVHVRTSYDVDVEFYGIVKIYNPVREALLRKAVGENSDPVAPNDAAIRTRFSGDLFRNWFMLAKK